MSELLLNYTDVSEKVALSSCVHEMYAGGRSDSLRVRISDTDGQFDKWNLRTGSPVEFKDSGTSTGKMFLYSSAPDSSYYDLRAYSMPPSGTIPNSKAWERVHFSQIGQEIAKRHGLEFESYGVSDHVYEYRKQENEEDFKFFGRLCTLERAALTIYNGKLIAAYEPYLEAIEPAITIDTTGCHVECEDNSVLSYGSATVSCGPYTGTYKAPGENSRIWVPQKPIKCQSTLEAIRFAAGVLREKNKIGKHYGIVCATDSEAIAVIDALEKRKIVVPSQVMVTGYDDVRMAKNFRIPLTAVHQPTGKMAREAAKQMLKLIAGEPVKKKNFKVPVELIRRNSTTEN